MEDKSVWYARSVKGDFKKVSTALGLDPVVAKALLGNIGTDDENYVQAYLKGKMTDCQAPDSIKDLSKAARLLNEKIANKKKIRIMGDYDADGITATTILMKTLMALGADVSYRIPDRHKDGYGLNVRLIEEAMTDEIDTILTCDNGIAAFDAVRQAKKAGMTVIITDHHEIMQRAGEPVFPEADIVVDCRRNDETAKFRAYCGAALAFQLSRLLLNGPQFEPLLEELACLASIATVTDVMPLKNDNRILVKYGLAHLPGTRNIGLQALYEETGIAGKKFTSYMLGFVIGPCLNASGRLASADIAVRLLLANDPGEAQELARQLSELNEQRKDMTAEQTEKAVALVAKKDIQKNPVLVLYLPDCPEAVAGIVAGRIKERFYRPTLVAVNGQQGAKGSGRSIKGYNLYQEMSKAADLFTAFGGHPKAAGFSLPIDNIKKLEEKLNEEQSMSEEDLVEKTMVDPLYVDYSNMENVARQLSLLEPFGEENSKPHFADRNLKVLAIRVYGRNKNVADVTLLTPRGTKVTAKMFGASGFSDGADLPRTGTKIAVCFEPGINSYKGNESLQLVIQKFKTL